MSARVPFPRELAVAEDGRSIRNADGKLTGVPMQWDHRLHFPLKRDDFASSAEWGEFQAWKAEESARRSMDRAARLRQDAENYRKLDTAEKRAMVKRAQRLRKELDTVESQLKEAGIEDWGSRS